MEYTGLSQKDTQMLEELILKYGNVLDYEDVASIFKNYYSDEGSIRNRVSVLQKAGWFKRIKKGVYFINENLGTRGQLVESVLVISSILESNAYISLSHALNYHQMYDQYSTKVTAIGKERGKSYKVGLYSFKFVKVEEEMYFGFSDTLVDGRLVKIADAEKALIDFLYLDKSFISANLVFEKLTLYKESFLDCSKLTTYVLKCGVTVRRKMGFLMESAGLNTLDIVKSLEGNRTAVKFYSDCKEFNSKWRVYYDSRIIK
ncbi:MAG: hypothetical protein WC988_00970 [Patescibacteria group bacterium]